LLRSVDGFHGEFLQEELEGPRHHHRRRLRDLADIFVGLHDALNARSQHGALRFGSHLKFTATAPTGNRWPKWAAWVSSYGTAVELAVTFNN
jgi:hypothetical protein